MGMCSSLPFEKKMGQTLLGLSNPINEMSYHIGSILEMKIDNDAGTEHDGLEMLTTSVRVEPAG